MKKKILVTALALFASVMILAGNSAAQADKHDFDNDHHDSDHHRHDHPAFSKFVPGTIVLSRTVYKGTAGTVTIGESLPPGCQPAGSAADAAAEPSADVNVPVLAADQPPATTAAAVSCGYASDNGEAPNLKDDHNVWNNVNTDPSFGVSSPIRLDDLTPDGELIGTLRVPSREIVTSFSSKSELALNRSADGKTLTFMGYRGGPGCPTLTLSGSGSSLTLSQGTSVGPISPTAANLIDVSNSNTPGLCDPTNPAVASYVGASGPTAYYRAVAEVDPWGHTFYTDTDDYSGDNSRAVVKGANWLYYVAGNDNNGGLSKSQLGITQLGFDLSHSTGAELVVPGQAPLVPPSNNTLGFFVVGKDKPGKDTNFRGLTIFDNTVYVTKGSGSNGVNTVYQMGPSGTLPTTSNAPGTPPATVNFPITPLPGFPQVAPTPDTSTTANTASEGGYYPFGVWFANSSTLYVCNEGDLVYTPNQIINGQVNVANSGDLAPNTMFSAGLQKWVLKSGTWVLQYVIQNGLNLGVPYSVPSYPASIEPATGGCRNLVGVVNRDGTATIYAITSTISLNGDNGADPNKLVTVTDVLNATALSTSGRYDHFTTIRSARAGEAFRGVALAPQDGDDWGHDRGDDWSWGR